MAIIHHPTSRSGFDWAELWENIFPIVFGLAASGASLLWGNDIVCLAKKHEWHLDQIYVGAFGLLAITTGYLATFYGSVQTMSSGFIGRIRNTHALKGFLVLIKRAIIGGFVVSLGSIPMMVAAPLPVERWSTESIVVAVWLGTAIWAIASFYRVASYLFFLFEEPEAPDEPAN